MLREIKREWYVIAHGQPRRFRAIKWVILIIGSLAIYKVYGVGVLWDVLRALAVLGILMHFFLRYKTHGWRQDWGRVKAIKTPFD